MKPMVAFRWLGALALFAGVVLLDACDSNMPRHHRRGMFAVIQ